MNATSRTRGRMAVVANKNLRYPLLFRDAVGRHRILSSALVASSRQSSSVLLSPATVAALGRQARPLVSSVSAFFSSTQVASSLSFPRHNNEETIIQKPPIVQSPTRSWVVPQPGIRSECSSCSARARARARAITTASCSCAGLTIAPQRQCRQDDDTRRNGRKTTEASASAAPSSCARWLSSSAVADTLTANDDDAVVDPAVQQTPTTATTAATTTTTTSATASSSHDDGDRGGGGRKVTVSKEEEREEETKRRKLSEVTVDEVLRAKHSFRWVEPVIGRDASVKEAIVATIEGGLSGMMVLEDNNNGGHDSTTNSGHVSDHPSQQRVVGLLTSRDLLRIMAAGIRDENCTDEELLSGRRVGDFMTPISQVIYGRPDETIGMCRTIMAKLGIKCLPILSRQGRVEGLLTARDMNDFGLTAADKGGKKSYLTNVSERVGLSSDTSMAEPPTYLKAHLALEQTPLYVNVGVATLPHPFKTQDGRVGRNQRDTRQAEYSSDPALSEDAHFVTCVTLPDEKTPTVRREATYFGVADGVGSWREYGVDPREFSHRLMEECSNLLQEAARNYDASVASSTGQEQQDQRQQHGGGGGNKKDGFVDGMKFRSVMPPAELMARAYQRTVAENVIGSCTACVALFDSVRHQLHFSNLGDCGILVLRHIDSDVAGALRRNRETPRTERKSDLRLSFVSQQQLLSFNHPFQLGWTGEELPQDETSSFKTAADACTTSVHIRRGDIIIMASDGLFDNVDVDDICQIALEWEQKNGFLRGGDIAARERRWQMGNSLTLLSSERISDLADALVRRARENSLNDQIDSPFAILAKENDIMWSGGMPDDCTVLAMHVVGRDARDVMDKPEQ